MCDKNQVIILLDEKPPVIFLVKSRDTFIFLLTTKVVGRAYGALKSLKYKGSHIPSRGREFPLLLKFDCQEKWVADIMEDFVYNFYAYDFAKHLVEDDDDEDDNEINYNTVDNIEEDSGQHNENESDIYRENFKLDFDSIDKEIPTVVISSKKLFSLSRSSSFYIFPLPLSSPFFFHCRKID